MQQTFEGMAYEDLGEGTPIVFFHPPGLGSQVFLFQKQLSTEYRLIMPDFNGHGDSDFDPELIPITKQVEQIHRLLDHLHIPKALLCGYSAGGCYAQEFALQYPERTLGILLSGGFPKIVTKGLYTEFLLGLIAVERFPRALARVLASSHTTDELVQEQLYQHMCKANVQAWYGMYHRCLLYDRTSSLQELGVPLLLVYGTMTPWIFPHGELYKQCPRHHVIHLKGATHQVPTKQWYTFNHIVRTFGGVVASKQV
ncbi:alpha/beta fold hydrolase [Bacillus fonticola]|uniref:alpha/beta fold hydrolase n=1 Tax=Bacillus fonticola TaxID=2728853 RepID=UPI001473E216|nr:alpha/beta hydrolase [Bacillus fonticola]